MKKSLLAVSAVLCAFAAQAQITISQADVAPLFTVALQATDTTPTVLPGIAGTNQTWNFSALNNQGIDSVEFTLPQFTPYGPSFPNSNTAIHQHGAAGVTYSFANNLSTGFAVNGIVSDPLGTGAIAIDMFDPELIIAFPTNYNTVVSDTAHGFAQFYYGQDPGIGFTVDSVRLHTSIFKNGVVDAWGSCTTPLGTYNVLRQNVLRRQMDTIDIYAFGNWAPAFFTQEDSNRVYTYWANGLGFPVAELTDQQDLGMITRATWTQSQTIGMNEYAHESSAKLYPNPASGTLFIETADKNAAWTEIFGTDGRLLLRTEMTGSITGIDVSTLAAGMYIYRTSDSQGKPLSHGKFNIAR